MHSPQEATINDSLSTLMMQQDNKFQEARDKMHAIITSSSDKETYKPIPHKRKDIIRGPFRSRG